MVYTGAVLGPTLGPRGWADWRLGDFRVQTTHPSLISSNNNNGDDGEDGQGGVATRLLGASYERPRRCGEAPGGGRRHRHRQLAGERRRDAHAVVAWR